MLYPALVLALTLVVAGVLGRVALPRLAGTLTEAGLPVPPLTRAIIELTRAGTTPAPWLILSLGALAVMTAGTLARARGYALPPPPILRDAHMSEWAASIAQLLQCGLTLPSAIRGSAPIALWPLGPLLRQLAGLARLPP
jgi:type IV pilus assembly protein PilC